jgi:signal peptidase II
MEDVPARVPAKHTGVRVSFRLRDAWFFVVVAVVVGLDQLIKWVIRNNLALGDTWPGDWPVKIIHITNSGAAFGILQGAGPLLVVTSLFGMAAILIYLFNPGFAHPIMRAGLALMLGGAIGNLIDRVYAGEVVDFIKFPHFPAFNVADSAITIGVLLLLWGMLEQTAEPPADDAS